MINLINRVADWNYTRQNIKYNSELEYIMLEEELDEFYEAHLGNDAVSQADALADIVFVALGSLYKLTGDHHKVEEIMEAVCNANDQKGTKKNKKGKIMKEKDFIPPEVSIKRILRA